MSGPEKRHVERMLLFPSEWIVSLSIQSSKTNHTEFRARRGAIVDCKMSVGRRRPELPCDNGPWMRKGQRMSQ